MCPMREGGGGWQSEREKTGRKSSEALDKAPVRQVSGPVVPRDRPHHQLNYIYRMLDVQGPRLGIPGANLALECVRGRECSTLRQQVKTQTRQIRTDAVSYTHLTLPTSLRV